MRLTSNCLLVLASVGLSLLGACQGPGNREAHSGNSPSLENWEETGLPLAETQSSSPASPTTEPDRHGEAAHQDGGLALGASPPNRDLHGPRDTAQYVEMLQSDQRIRELKPDLVAERIFESAGLSPDSVVADIGCGPGIFVWPLVKFIPAGFVFAVDVEPAQLDALREGLIERRIENVVPVLASYSTPHLPRSSCDAIFIADTYHHIEERIAYLELLRTRLKPGGFLVLLEYKDGDLPVGPPASHKVLKTDRQEELRQAGFELDRELSTHLFHDFEFWRVRRAGK
ncbi:MAG: SAM-dependent methyltransferase [Bacteroidia bacterium]|jgi:SAM-dependent methyltransferase